MANLSLSFRNKGGMFALCATVSKTTTRHYKKVEGLVSPNFDSWDSKKQIFNEPTENAIHNNKVLQEIKERILVNTLFYSSIDLLTQSSHSPSLRSLSVLTIRFPHCSQE